MSSDNGQGTFGRPDSTSVREFHTFDDLDVSSDAHHHSLGAGVNQAASGAHTHDGANSALLLEGQTITGTKGTASFDSSVAALLVRLGATDSST